ncbi:hypothetical protein CFter6_1269 [Collimonas fungivorans]|uniref:Uncharacterized protein n=1 Tax=Collimonas fungivorans TaxID=158899 RepID=A0A127P979_9BURK|nr:hypothetical protein CFter6_1269 [Collimonas fungivorans]
MHQDTALLIYPKDNIFCYKLFGRVTNSHIALQIYDSGLSKNAKFVVKAQYCINKYAEIIG